MGSSELAFVFLRLRKLAVENPREARASFSQLLDSEPTVVDGLLKLASAPGEGRIRQLIANAVKNRSDKSRVAHHLRSWLASETDEFAKAAINAAVQGVELEVFPQITPPEPPRIVETYRYVADRLCHRVRNSLTGPAQHLRTLEYLLNGGTDARSLEAKAAVIQLKDSLRSLSRIVEFNIDDSYFEWRAIDIVAWLSAMTFRYIANNSPLSVRIPNADGHPDARIRANDLLLEVLFWNIWKNAQQAVENPCEITIEVKRLNGWLELLIIDNGPGFSAEDTAVAFIDQFSSKGTNHGRGLLEVHDAVRRLGGSVALVPYRARDFRIQLRFPAV